MSETKLQREIQVALSQTGARLFRNQSGTYQLKDGRYLSSGLCSGSSDLIGWTPTVITSDMLGKTLATFTAVEVKSRNGRLTKEQQAFLEAVSASGGIAVVARSIEDAIRGVSGREASTQD